MAHIFDEYPVHGRVASDSRIKQARERVPEFEQSLGKALWLQGNSARAGYCVRQSVDPPDVFITNTYLRYSRRPDTGPPLMLPSPEILKDVPWVIMSAISLDGT